MDSADLHSASLPRPSQAKAQTQPQTPTQTQTHDKRLGEYLRDRRCRLDATALGYPAGRRRTPGLRREEVAQRAHVSTTWYTWLEQGRGGAPSARVLERIASALMLTDVEREHLFLLGLGRQPDIQPHEIAGVSPRLQRVLDALPHSPALIRTALWDVVAWNTAARRVLSDYDQLPPAERNVLRRLFLDPQMRALQQDWESVARYVVASFRIDAARVGATRQQQALVDELSARSPDFLRLWHDHEVSHHGGGTKLLQHSIVGPLQLEFSSFAVDGRPDLSLLVYNPATAADAANLRKLLESPLDGGRAPAIQTVTQYSPAPASQSGP